MHESTTLNHERELLKVWDPFGAPGAELVLSMDVLEGFIVIIQHERLVDQVVPPVFERLDDGEELWLSSVCFGVLM